MDKAQSVRPQDSSDRMVGFKRCSRIRGKVCGNGRRRWSPMAVSLKIVAERNRALQHMVD